MDSAYCLQQAVKMQRNNITTEMIVATQDYKTIDQMKPSAASLVQRYTRNGKQYFENRNFVAHKVIMFYLIAYEDIDTPTPFGRLTNNNFHRPKTAKVRLQTVKPNRSEQFNRTVGPHTEWIVKSGCHFSCINQSMGIQIIASKLDRTTNIQLCNAEFIVSFIQSRKIHLLNVHVFFLILSQSCDKIETTQEFATSLCRKYQKKVRGLSGNGMQIAPSTIDPDRGCKVACQDEFLSHRFYLVNGEHGFFPFGTKCSRSAGNENRYCVNGKCLQFDKQNIPLVESHISLALYRSRRSIP